MTFPTTSILDDFNRSDEGPPPSADWSTDPRNVGTLGLVVQSNELRTESGANDGEAWWSGDAFGPDQEMYLTLTYGGDFPNMEMWLRVDGAGTSGVTAYLLYVSHSDIRFQKYVSGSYTTLGSVIGHSLDTGWSVGFSVVGSTLTSYLKDNVGGAWTQFHTETDTSLTTGDNLAFLAFDDNLTYDDFGGGTYAGGAPANTAAPVVTGTVTDTTSLSVSDGTWTHSPTFTYQWQRDGVDISGETASTHTVVTADLGHAIKCIVTGTNGDGSAAADSNTLSPPANTVLPDITGTPAIGETLTVSDGTWTNTPTSYAYQWNRDAAPIVGATASSYLLASLDADTDITCTVTATNADGDTPATSTAENPLADPPPSVDWTVEIGFDWDGDLDTEPTWTDVTEYASAITTRTGRRSALDKFDAGTATVVLDNSDGRFDPENTAGPYYPDVEHGKPLRLRALSGLYTKFVGIIDGIAPEFVAGMAPECVVSATDAFASFALDDPALLGGTATRGAELSGVRAKALGCHASSDDGLSTLSAATFDSGNLLGIFQDCAESEAGLLYCDPTVGLGFRPVFLDRQFRFRNPTSIEVGYEFGDSDAEIYVDKMEGSYDTHEFYDHVVVNLLSGGSVSAGTGKRTLTRSLQSDDAIEAADHANYHLQVYGTKDLRIDSLTWRLGTGTVDSITPAFALKISDRVRVIRRPAAGVTITKECWVEGIEFNVGGGQLDALCTIRLSPADSRTFWTIGTSTLGETTRLGY